MYLALLSRKHDIISSQNKKKSRRMGLSRKLEDLQKYSSSVGKRSISMADMMGAPASMFGRMLMFTQHAHNNSVMGAKQQMTAMGPAMAAQMQQMQDPQQRHLYQNWIMTNLYNQQKEAICKQEEKFLNEQEKEIQHEMAQIDVELKMLEEDYKACEAGIKAGIEMIKPNYTGLA